MVEFSVVIIKNCDQPKRLPYFYVAMFDNLYCLVLYKVYYIVFDDHDLLYNG